MKKIYYSISEVSRLLELAPWVLRYWESEFRELQPKKNSAGNRIYRQSDIELIREIRQLLHLNRFTIEGARLELKRRRSKRSSGTNGKSQTSPNAGNSKPDPELTGEIRRTLREILTLLD